jgi:hypothetical protein
VEGGGHDFAFSDEDWKAVAGGEDFDLWAGGEDAGSADEDGFHLSCWLVGIAGQGGIEREDGGVVLTAVGVALDGDVEETEAVLGGIADVFGEQDGSGAGAEDGFLLGEGLEGFEEPAFAFPSLQEFEHGGGFAAGEDQAVERFEGFWGFDQGRDGSGFFEGGGVALVVALNGEDADVGLGGWVRVQCLSPC